MTHEEMLRARVSGQCFDAQCFLEAFACAHYITCPYLPFVRVHFAASILHPISHTTAATHPSRLSIAAHVLPAPVTCPHARVECNALARAHRPPTATVGIAADDHGATRAAAGLVVVHPEGGEGACRATGKSLLESERNESKVRKEKQG